MQFVDHGRTASRQTLFPSYQLATMKRSAEAMDSRDLKDGDCSSGRSSRKHIRSADERRSRNRNEGITVKTLSDEKETDPHRLAQRQKQIDYGKNTIGYDRYCAQVPRRERRRGKHPMTPDKNLCVGKKVFDGFVRKWRQALHKYDPPELAEVTLAASAARSTRAESEEKGSAEGIVPSSEHAAAIATCLDHIIECFRSEEDDKNRRRTFRDASSNDIRNLR